MTRLLERAAELLARATPGPWKVMPVEARVRYVRVRGTRLGERYKIANALGGAHDLEKDEALANAELIALAPTLAARVVELEGALRAALDAANSFQDEDGYQVASQVRIRIDAALPATEGGE